MPDVLSREPIFVAAPHDWDGIGQALRCAYRNHRDPPREITTMLDRLDQMN